jgi:hypothetical protein
VLLLPPPRSADSFRADTLAIAGAVPRRRQLLALSATFAPAALDRLRSLMGGRQQEVLLCAEDTALLGVRQCYRLLHAGGSAAAPQPRTSQAQQAPGQEAEQAAGSGAEWLQPRVAALLQLLSAVSFQQAVVFCKYRAGASPAVPRRPLPVTPAAAARLSETFLECPRGFPAASAASQRAAAPLPTADAEAVAQRLLAAGYPAAPLSAQRSQLERIEALNALRDFRWATGQWVEQVGGRAFPVWRGGWGGSTPPPPPPLRSPRAAALREPPAWGSHPRRRRPARKAPHRWCL